ncbi:hypothetical protein ACET3X_007755 [Alternaria dauci]|uniref:DUF6590 domain-containing protein n=1 Tax=Alternaria dauci TaxID=48095 RepID=A0ABR3UDC9_9PLEO
MMRLRGSDRFQPAYGFTYEGVIMNGDCGSLVSDKFTKKLYGMVIAASDSQSIAYMIAADGLVQNLEENGQWYLLDVYDNRTDSRHSHDTVSYRQDASNSQAASSVKQQSTSESSLRYPQDTSSSQAASSAKQQLSYGVSSIQQPEWNAEHSIYLLKLWDEQYQRNYWLHHIEGQGWVFFRWCDDRVDSMFSGAAQADSASRRGIGPAIQGTYDHTRPTPNSHFEHLDSCKDRSFFQPGKVFAVLFSDGAGSTVTRYNDSISLVKYGEFVHTQIRRFIVVRMKQGFAYCVPIFTYNNQGTKKPGVIPREHAVAYSYGYQPLLLPNEVGIEKEPICIVMNPHEPALSTASRIFFGIQHPIQYNVKVKDLGYVHPDHLSNFLGYWAMEHQIGTMQDVLGSDQEDDASCTYSSAIA